MKCDKSPTYVLGSLPLISRANERADIHHRKKGRKWGEKKVDGGEWIALPIPPTLPRTMCRHSEKGEVKGGGKKGRKVGATLLPAAMGGE